MNQLIPNRNKALEPKSENQTTLVILAPNDPQGKLVLQGIFGHLVSKDETTNQVEVRLDEQLVACSSIFASYAGGATFRVSADEAIIVQSDNSDAIESLKATLTASLAQNWGARYERLMGGAGSMLRHALEAEMATALNGAQALIDAKNVSPASIPVSAFTIASESQGNLTEMVLLKAPVSRTIAPEQLTSESASFTPSRDLSHLPEQNEPMVYRHNGHLNALLKKGVSPHAFANLLSQSDEALFLVLEQLKAEFESDYTLLSATQAAAAIARESASPISETFSRSLDEFAQSQMTPPTERLNQ